MAARQGEVQSVTRALRLLSCLGEAGEGQRLTDLARASGLAVSTVHRLLITMQESGFVHFDRRDNVWHVGREAFSIAGAYVRRRNYVGPGLAHLRRLRDETRETANLGVLDNGRLLTLAQVESREIARSASGPGSGVPAACSAMGKAILATWEDDEVSDFCRRNRLQRLTPSSHVCITSLLADLAEVRARGYALDDEEAASGIRCIAAAVWSPHREAVCAVSVSGLASRLTQERSARVGSLVCEAARNLTSDIGGLAPAIPDLTLPHCARSSIKLRQLVEAVPARRKILC